VPLTIRGAQPQSVFGLTGADENSATFALGWVLEQSPQLLEAVVDAVFGEKLDVSDSAITLQRHAEDGGFTDLEIQAGLRFHSILEAKRYWDVPDTLQLKRYVGRLLEAKTDRRRMITVSAASAALAQRQLPSSLQGVPIVHLSWTDLQRLARRAKSASTRHDEKLWLNQFILHLQEFVSMERTTDNKVYVVSLGATPMGPGKKQTWIEVVEKDGCYFHPVGDTWPVQPPNYIGFRYRGQLQSVHHIESWDILRNVADRNPNWATTTRDHFVYQLGPAMRPQKEVRTGRLYMTLRVWCAIDTLLSGAFATISDARDETKRRLDEIE